MSAATTIETGYHEQAGTVRAALRQAAWLSEVPAATLDRLAQRAVMHRMPADSILFEQAETPAFALLLVSGSVELLALRGAEENLIEIVRAPDMLLPAAVLNRQPYLLRARVLHPARLVMIEAEAFRRAVASDHALCLAMLACQAVHFRRQVKQAKNVKLRSAEERVGCYLRALIESAPGGEAVRLPAEKRLIASQLGMTRETFSRALAGVARNGIRVEGDGVVLTDKGAATHGFPLDPLIDGSETIVPLAVRRS